MSDAHKSMAFYRIGYAYDRAAMNQRDVALEWYTKTINLGLQDKWTAAGLNNRGAIYHEREEWDSCAIDMSRRRRICFD